MNAETREQRLTVPLALALLDRHERRRGTIVQHVRVGDAEPALQKRRETARHTQIRFDQPGIAPLEPPRQPDRRMPVAQTKPQERVPEVVPVDDEPHAPAAQRPPGHGERREGRWVLHQDQVGTRQLPQRPPQAKAQTRRHRTDRRSHSSIRTGCARIRRRVFLMRWTVIRGSPVTRLESGVPSRPTRSTSTPFDTSACAWYCMRALRPRSPSATTAALIRERVSKGGEGILSRFQEAALDQSHDGRFLGAERRPEAGRSRRAPSRDCQRHAVHRGWPRPRAGRTWPEQKRLPHAGLP